ncbi:hypothetical protein AOQ84DRAFT_393816 [Glonium stellatum]|uniref:Programmed cell death protein 2 C-terminal domain-containing protein n=1 Tax=Glonium stellatum TaxID=574774 RepID=A0A8E2EM11_9PEZI|nr:hypothetical protein AOQ84DRAFT_393816 [Glonium stellatum]
MADYDSDSSGGEEDYTETNVLLGFASKEPTGDSISHLGGYPTWLDDSTAPSGALAKCKVCNDLLTLLLELNGDLPEHFPGHERRLYMFSCKRKTCRRKEGSVRGIRATRVTKAQGGKSVSKVQEALAAQKEEKKPQANIGESLFGVTAPGASSTAANPFTNPFSTSSTGKAPANPFAAPSAAGTNPFSTPLSPPATTNPTSPTDTTTAVSTLPETFAQKVRLNSPSASTTTTTPPRPHAPWPSQSAFPLPYPTYYLDADYETLSAPPTPEIPSTARMDIDNDPASSSNNNGKEDKEAFESTLDKTFQRFADRLAHNPEQVLRYEFRGSPLLYSKTDGVGKLLTPAVEAGVGKVVTSAGTASGMPRCGNCGAERVFEVQLTPHAIAELEAEEMGLEGMEWGTVILGVCGKDCAARDVGEGEVGYLEEWVGVQWEEVAKRG